MNLRIALALVAAALFSTGVSAGWSKPCFGGWMNGQNPLPQTDDQSITICLPVIIIDNDAWDIDYVCKDIPRQPRRGGPRGERGGNWFDNDDRPGRGMGLLRMLMNRLGDRGDCQPEEQPQPIRAAAVPTPGAAVAGMAMLGLIAGRRRRKG